MELRSGSEEFVYFGLGLSIDCLASLSLCTDVYNYTYVTTKHGGIYGACENGEHETVDYVRVHSMNLDSLMDGKYGFRTSLQHQHQTILLNLISGRSLYSAITSTYNIPTIKV